MKPLLCSWNCRGNPRFYSCLSSSVFSAKKTKSPRLPTLILGFSLSVPTEMQSLQSDIQRQLLLTCDSHYPDSTVFLSTHSLFVHQKELYLSLLPLHLLLQKLQALSPSSTKQYFDILLREFHVLGLMYSVLSELPKSARLLELLISQQTINTCFNFVFLEAGAFSLSGSAAE